ncbi:hypothetical protein KQI52_02845 [bacterium]|nr:hypothetical protein [bacterium]
MVKKDLKKRKGSVLLYSVVLMLVLVVTAGAFMKWAADEAYQANYDLARSQAYYIAQKGAIEQGMSHLRSKKYYELTAASVDLPDGREMDYGDFRGRYEGAEVLQQTTLYDLQDSEFLRTGAWDATAVGVVEMEQPNGDKVEVKTRYTLRSQMRTFANYMYLSDIETAAPPDSSGDDVIWFYTGDTLYGRVHSNDYIGIKQSPVFYGPVSTSKDEFREYAASAHFEYEPQFNVPEVYFPEQADDIRNGAANQGNFFSSNNNTWLYQFEGNNGGWDWYKWERGTGVEPNDNNVIDFGYVAYSLNTICFVEGDLYIKGELVQGKSTISSGGQMYLIDNVKYADVSVVAPSIPDNSPNILGLVSEKNIIIRNSTRNGKENGGNDNPNAPHDQAHIVITAGLVALGQSFTFEHQNDTIEGTCNANSTPQEAPWDHGSYLYTGGQDERGYIYIRGAVAQQRRGYVHRSNCGGTGYDKSYDYDFRLQTNPPPLYLAAQDADGNIFFEVTSSWAEFVTD